MSFARIQQLSFHLLKNAMSLEEEESQNPGFTMNATSGRGLLPALMSSLRYSA